MSGNVPQERIDEILSVKITPQDRKDLFRIYLSLIVFCGGMTIVWIVCSIILLTRFHDWKTALGSFLFAVLPLALLLWGFVYTRTIHPRKKYEESVRKHEWMLRKELQSEDSVAFFIDEKEVESISIITRNFFFGYHLAVKIILNLSLTPIDEVFTICR